MSKKLFLLDAYALIYRAYYAFIKNPRINSKGINTSAIFGFTNTLYEILDKEKPSHIAVVFDPPTKTFRHDMYPEYKAQRPPTPEDIKKSVPYIKEIIRAFGIPTYEVNYFEADDVVGTLAKKAEQQGFTVFMMTVDKDYCQLVSENIFMYKPKRFGNDIEIWGIPEVCEKFAIENPLQVIDVLALWGDASDNVPGVQGIGEKTAKKLIKQYGSTEKLVENAQDLKGKQKEKLLASVEQLKLSKELVTIKIDVDIEINEQELEYKDWNRDKLKELFDELEFKTTAARILKIQDKPKQQAQPAQGSLFGQEVMEEMVTQPEKQSIDNTEHNYQLIETEEQRKELVAKLNSVTEFCFDTETTGLDTLTAELVGIAFSYENHKAFYVPIPANREQAKSILNEFKPVFENTATTKIGQNIKFDIMMLQQYGVQTAGELFDTMIAHYLLFPDQKHNLTFLSEKYLTYQPVEIEELIGKKGKSQLNMRNVALDKVKEYAGEDADITYQLKEKLAKELLKEGLYILFRDIEMPLIYVLAEMEHNGVRVNTSALKEYANQLRTDIIKIEGEILKMAGIQFNVASPKQLGEVLFDHMKIVENQKKTSKSKQYSTSEQELLKLKDKHDIIPKILEFRSLSKLLSTYVDALPKLINHKTGKIHTSYNQAVAATGRLSSTNPNLQNIPIKTAKGREIRKAFIPNDEKHIILAADYSQIELRLIAHICKDKNMVEAFRQQKDFHTATAAKIYNVPEGEVTREMRGNAKSANFGIVYGISAFGLSQNLSISRKEAKELIDGYFAAYPGVKTFMDKNISDARKYKYVETMLGRKRYLADIDSKNGVVRGIAERNAINAPIQGSAADVIKIAMINVQKRLKEEKLQSKMILQVHDELVFDVYKPELEKVTEIVEFEMKNAVETDIPLLVESGIGNNWLEAH